MIVTITGCSYKRAWYKDMIGETIEVSEGGKLCPPAYMAAKNGKHILREDIDMECQHEPQVTNSENGLFMRYCKKCLKSY